MTTVYLTMAESFPGEWRRVGPVYRSKEVAKSWVPFVKGRWFCPVRVKTVRIKTEDGKPTEAAKREFSEKYNIDLT